MAGLSEQERENFETQNQSGLQHVALKSQTPNSWNEAPILNYYPSPSKTLTSETDPQTPHRAAPNSSRKRLYSPILFRDRASPSHSARIASLFEDTASTLQFAMTPSRHALSNTRKLRIPSYQSRFTKFGHGHDNKAMPAPMYARTCDDEERFSNVKRPEQGCEVLGSAPGNSKTVEPFESHKIENGHPARGLLNNVPQTPISPDLSEIATTFQAINNPVQYSHTQRPIDYGFITSPHYRNPSNERCAVTWAPDVETVGLPRSSHPNILSDSDDEEHSTHGVRLIMPYSHCEAVEAQQASVEAWLEQVLEASNETDHVTNGDYHDKADAQDTIWPGKSISAGSLADSESEHAHKDQSPDRPSSDKENVPPPLPPRVPPPPYSSSISAPSQFKSNARRNMALQQHDALASKFTHSLTPRGVLAAAPKRKKLQIPEKASIQSELERMNFKDFTIRDDGLTAALATLTPSVERHRKGHRPKKERYASYWDKDILEPDDLAVRVENVQEL